MAVDAVGGVEILLSLCFCIGGLLKMSGEIVKRAGADDPGNFAAGGL